MPFLHRLVVATLVTALGSAGSARADELSIAVGQTRGGIPVVAIQGGPWGVVALHARLGEGELTPTERGALEAVAQALADGATGTGSAAGGPAGVGKTRTISADVSDVGGRSRWRVGPDHLVVAQGAPMERFDVLLRAVDATLKERARLAPATRAVERLPAEEPSVDMRALALAAPGSPVALSTSLTKAPEPAVLRATVDKLLRRDRVVLSVVGPVPAPELLAQVLRTVTTPLPSSSTAQPALLPVALDGTAGVLGEGTRLFEGIDADKKGASSTVWMLSAGRGTAGANPKDRAARAVLARLAGGRSEGTDVIFGMAFDVESARATQIARAEATPLARLQSVAQTPPPAEAVELARTQERSARLARLKDADAVADALGRALLAGDAGLVDKELAALQQITPDDIAAAARAALGGPRVVVRMLGGRR